MAKQRSYRFKGGIVFQWEAGEDFTVRARSREEAIEKAKRHLFSEEFMEALCEGTELEAALGDFHNTIKHAFQDGNYWLDRSGKNVALGRGPLMKKPREK